MLRGIEAQRRREGEPMLYSVLRSLERSLEGEAADFQKIPEWMAEEARKWAEEYPAWPLPTAAGQSPGVSHPAQVDPANAKETPVSWRAADQCEEGVRARSAAGQQRVRWADDEAPIDIATAEQVARALAVDCDIREKRLAEMRRGAYAKQFERSTDVARTLGIRSRAVKSEEQPRVRDESDCVE